MKFYLLRKKNILSPASFHHDQGNGYDSNDEKMFGHLLSLSKYSDQIVIHLTDNRDYIYYLYVRRISHGWLGIGIKHFELCKDFHTLYNVFEYIISELLEWPQPIVIKKKSNQQICHSSKKFEHENDEILLFKSTFEKHFDYAFKSATRLDSITFPDSIFQTLIERNLYKVGNDEIINLINKGCNHLLVTKQDFRRDSFYERLFKFVQKRKSDILVAIIAGLFGVFLGYLDDINWGRGIKKQQHVGQRPDTSLHGNHIAPTNFKDEMNSHRLAVVVHVPNNFVHISPDASDFYIDKNEVTQKDYEALMGNNPSEYQGDSLPVHGMSVRDAVIYCNKKSEDEGYRGFYDFDGNVVTQKSGGNGYRLPTEREWILASKKTKENADEKPRPIRPYQQKVGNPDFKPNTVGETHDKRRFELLDFKPHVVGKIQDKRRELFDVYGNVCELCVRSNGEIWGKGGSYRIVLDSESSEEGGLKAAENLSSTIKLNADFGMRLVFIP